MFQTVLRSSWLRIGFVTLAFTLSLWVGCNQPQENASEPIVGQQAGTLSKAHPAVAAAIAVQERHTDELLTLPDVVGTGIGADQDGKPVILVLTRVEPASDIPSHLEGVKTRVDVVGEVRPMAGYTKTYRPVPCGVSVGNDLECSAGTIGCVVTIGGGGTKYLLSNNHVLARQNAAAIGERLDQPGRYDGKPICARTGQVAILSAFKVIYTTSNNVIDAAIAEYTTSSVCSMVDNLFTPSGTVVAPSVGLAVKKVGRTSGLTTGTIAGINVTINVAYDFGAAKFVNQIYVASNFIRSGDSGSMMVTQSGNNPVGLDFAGSGGASFANPIGPVLSFFNATVCSN